MTIKHALCTSVLKFGKFNWNQIDNQIVVIILPENMHLRRYKKILQDKNKSGRGRRTWEHFEVLHEVSASEVIRHAGAI